MSAMGEWHVATARPEAMAGPMRWLGPIAAHGKTIMSFAGLLLLWEVCVHAFDVKLYILPPPSVVLVALVTKSGTIAHAAWFTAQPMLIGFAFAMGMAEWQPNSRASSSFPPRPAPQ